MNLGFSGFGGEYPVLAATNLPQNGAQTAQNCRFDNGNLRPLRGTLTDWTPSKAGTIKSIFRYAGAYWFHWITEVHAVQLAVGGDQLFRTAWTGEGTPKITDSSIATSGGGTDYPINSYDLGIPKPAAAPTLVATGTPPESEDDYEPRAYVYTYVSAWGEEGPPSDPSNTALIGPEQTGDLSGMSTGPAGSYNIATKRIYCVNTGSETAEYQLVDETPVAQTTYSDSLPATDRTDVLATEDYDMPPADMAGLTALPNRVLFAHSKNEVCFCEPGQYHAWPEKYRIAVDGGDIVGGGAYGASVAVVTESGMPYVITGDHPEVMTAERLEVGMACVSSRSIVDLGYAIAYASPDGLVVIGTGTVKNVTEDVFGKDAWEDLDPTSILGVNFNGFYLGFYDNGTTQGGFIFSPSSGVVMLDIHATAAWADIANGKTFICNSATGDIEEFDAGDALTYTWRSRKEQGPRPINFAVAEVIAEDYPVTFSLYGDGVLRHTETVGSRRPFSLPRGYLADDWEIQIEGSADVRSVVIAESTRELRSR